MATTTGKQTLRIGVLFEAVQFSDIMGVDIFGNISTEYVDTVAGLDPAVAPFQEHSIPMEFFYISSSLVPAATTASARIQPNVTYDDAPRDLDIVIIGGPLPSHRPTAADKFMKEAWESTKTWITTCIGSIWLASSGVLKGKKCTTNRMFLPVAKQMHPDVEWVDQRWVVDEKPYSGEGGKGEIWTSGGAGAGIDMIATYALTKFNSDLVRKVALEALEFDPEIRGQFYKQ